MTIPADEPPNGVLVYAENHVLRHKFGELPLSILRQVETTMDANQLNRWLDKALDAQTLDPRDFDLPL